MTRYIDPDRDAFRQFAKMDIAGPVQMLNLLRFRARADYEDGREATGVEAYKAYGRESEPIFTRVGGQIIWNGKPQVPLIGPADETWHAGFIAEYPSKDAFIEMVKDPAYQAIVFHRQAAVETSRLYCFEKRETGSGFAA
ncbi:DUF1330 domain-containing protein [Parvularcula flava]|uniref:DUF1330 domain-containing protein n=1 Tax=Aquisalinus luteolus TaxID=1566827 RepID=A0A8J3ESA0_9PROT|nr:DUF1330 domain-containing protein [Aquisalinus luteolus]NHK29436.1 DUF1330 domain-containing protein [Aquisalinus luteolus]GGI01957.1 hypothetical protein GCM10011355_33820 [Aquisalinus luteolus]